MRNRLSYLWRGLLYGALAGLVAAEIYIAFIAIVSLVIQGFSVAASTFLIGHIIGVVPGTGIGSFVGLLTGLAFTFTFTGENLHAKAGAVFGFMLASLLLLLTVAGLLVAKGSEIGNWQIDFQGFVTFVLPILLLFPASGAWGGRKLAMSARPHAQDKLDPNLS